MAVEQPVGKCANKNDTPDKAKCGRKDGGVAVQTDITTTPKMVAEQMKERGKSSPLRWQTKNSS
eukprot:6976179-Ditylum_brightwellii.AAC.1